MTKKYLRTENSKFTRATREMIKDPLVNIALKQELTELQKIADINDFQSLVKNQKEISSILSNSNDKFEVITELLLKKYSIMEHQLDKDELTAFEEIKILNFPNLFAFEKADCYFSTLKYLEFYRKDSPVSSYQTLDGVTHRFDNTKDFLMFGLEECKKEYSFSTSLDGELELFAEKAMANLIGEITHTEL